MRVLVAGARALDLQRRVVDAEPLVELVRDAGEERIVVAGILPDQVRGHRHLVRAQRPDMQVVDRRYARLRAEEGLYRGLVDAVGHRVHRGVETVAEQGEGAGGDHAAPQSSEERRAGQEVVSTCRSRWAPY